MAKLEPIMWANKNPHSNIRREQRSRENRKLNKASTDDTFSFGMMEALQSSGQKK